MCGIAGIVDFERDVDSKSLATMANVLAHRGPDDEGFCIYSEGKLEQFSGHQSVPEVKQHFQQLTEGKFRGVGFVHKRLSIVDLSPAGHQPMLHPDSGCIVNFNGEIYNYNEIAKRYCDGDEAMSSDCDTEVILHSYLNQGCDNVKLFRGMWAYALLDTRKKRLILSRDRFGIKPLYYWKKGSRLIFASEIKAILALAEVDPIARRENLAQFVSYGALKNSNDVLFEDIHSVEAGTQLIIDLEDRLLSGRSVKYHQFENTKSSTVEEFDEAFERSVQLHMNADVDVGSCLSGGLDSSAIVYRAAAMNKGPFHTFTARFDEPEIDESDYARSLSDRCPNLVQKFVTPTAEELMEDWDRMIYHQDEPVGSSSIFAQWAVMKSARESGMKVLLDGQGSDEVLGGYYNFAGLHVLDKVKKLQFAESRKAYRQLKENFTPAMADAVKRASFPMLPETLKRHARRSNRLGINLFSKEMSSFIKETKAPDRNGRNFREHAELSVKNGLLELLRYEDRNSMAFSIESRVPFLDHELVQVGLNLPPETLIKDGWTKWPIRRMLDGRLDDNLVWRKEKKGFLTPQQAWKDQLLPFMLRNIDQAENRIFDIEKLEFWMKKKELTNSQLSELWRIFSVIRWMSVFKVKVI